MPFRPPTKADANDVTALLIACDIADFGTPDFDVEALMIEWSEVDLEHDAFLTDGAYGHLVRTDMRAWVDPRRRGEGLGTALLTRLEERAREKGMTFVDQQMAHSDTAGADLLRGRGWQPLLSYADMRLPDARVDELPQPVGVRAYAPSDEQAVQALMEAAFDGGAGRVEPLASLRDRAADTSAWFVVDAPTGGLAGAIRAELRAGGFIRGYIASIAVDPAHRGQGTASALIGAAGRALIEQGAIDVRLFVRSSNPNALALYERLGFEGTWDVDEYRLSIS